ncbi:MAG: peptidylprolyl isomerase, partial [Pseudomonadota bacterium]
MIKVIRQLSLICISLTLAASVNATTEITLDSIVAIVDESVITRRQLENRIQLVKLELKRGNRNTPNSETLERQVLEGLINDSLLLQEAARRGIKVTDSQLNQTMQSIAKQNNMNLSDYRRALIGEGLNYDKYRETVRRELIISSLQRQYGNRNANISDAEVDDFLARSDDDETDYEYQLSHILIALPDAATPDEVGEAQNTAEDILTRLNQGSAFESLANTFSSSSNALQGGDLGWRKKAEIPSLFTEKVLQMKPGEYAGPIRSASGLHIVHLKDRVMLGQVLTKQTRSRHILIRPNELISEEDSRERLTELRKRILAGEDFERLA